MVQSKDINTWYYFARNVVVPYRKTWEHLWKDRNMKKQKDPFSSVCLIIYHPSIIFLISLTVPITHFPPPIIVSLVQWHIFYFSNTTEYICNGREHWMSALTVNKYPVIYIEAKVIFFFLPWLHRQKTLTWWNRNSYIILIYLENQN